MRHTVVQGWVCDEADPDRSIVVSIFANGLFVACTIANRFRGDLIAGGIGNGCHGFEFDLSGKVATVNSIALTVANSEYQLESFGTMNYQELNECLAASSQSPSPSTADLSLDADLLARLNHLTITNARKYRTAEPFPFVAFDDFLPSQAANRAHRDFPRPKAVDWFNFSDGYTEGKLAFSHVELLPASLKAIIQFFDSKPFLQFLENLTGIEGLIPDPYYMGGGLHQIERGGKLDIHVDFNRHPKLRLDRRLNLLLYLNEDWHEEYGGHLELWKRDMSAAAERILPVFNRCVIFNTSEWSYHGHPDPLNCPADRTRKSIALYYYTNGRPEEERAEPHLTLWRQRPD
jgi:hypothetical protein